MEGGAGELPGGSPPHPQPGGEMPPPPQSAGDPDDGYDPCASTLLHHLSEELDSSKRAAAARADETTMARMWGASQAIKLKRASTELDATLRECTKERRLRRAADDAKDRLQARVEQLEGLLDDPRVKAVLAGPAGLSLEASQALVAKLHESHERTRACEARLKQAEQELAQAATAAARASSIPTLQKHISDLARELEEAQACIGALEARLAEKSPLLSNTASQVDSGDMFDMVDSRCEDLRRCMERAEREKVAAEAYSIQTKAELARAEHRLSCLEQEISAHRQNSPQTRGPCERAGGDAHPEGGSFAKDLSTCQRQLQTCRKELEQARSVAQNAREDARAEMELLLAQRIEQARSAWRLRESKLEDNVLDLQRRLLVAEQQISQTSDAKRNVERTAQQNLVRAQGYLEQLNLSKACLNASDQKVRAGEAKVHTHLRMANEVIHQQVRMLRHAIHRVRASGRSCSGQCQDVVNRISLQVESMRACDFSDMDSLQHLARQSGHGDCARHGSAASPRSPLLLDSSNHRAPSPSSSHASPASLPGRRRSPRSRSSSEGTSPIVMPIIPRAATPSSMPASRRARPAADQLRGALDLNSTAQDRPSAREIAANESRKDGTDDHTKDDGGSSILPGPGPAVRGDALTEEPCQDHGIFALPRTRTTDSIGNFTSQAQWVSARP
jgi:hypothetical protein